MGSNTFGISETQSALDHSGSSIRNLEDALSHIDRDPIHNRDFDERFERRSLDQIARDAGYNF